MPPPTLEECWEFLGIYQDSNALIESERGTFPLSSDTVMVYRDLLTSDFWFFQSDPRKTDINLIEIYHPEKRKKTGAFVDLECDEVVGILPIEEYESLEDWEGYIVHPGDFEKHS